MSFENKLWMFYSAYESGLCVQTYDSYLQKWRMKGSDTLGEAINKKIYPAHQLRNLNIERTLKDAVIFKPL